MDTIPDPMPNPDGVHLDLNPDDVQQYKGDKEDLVADESGRYNKLKEDTSGSSISDGIQETRPLSQPLQNTKSGCVKHGEGLKVIIISTVVLALAVTVALIIQICVGPPQVPPHGAVASDVSECSIIGTDILKKGGSGVDAAIATTFCVGVVNSFASGIGGGGFMTVHEHGILKPHTTRVINFRETAPAGASKNMYANDYNASLIGGLSVGIPGELKGLEKAYDLYGKLSWKELVLPSVGVARNGFKCSKTLENTLKLRANKAMFLKSPILKESFMRDEGARFVREGEVVKRPELAKTLEILAESGASAFYDGSLTDGIISAVKKEGGILTRDDLRKYEVAVVDPLITTYEEYEVMTAPPPSSGASLLLALHMLDLMNVTQKDENATQFSHKMIEMFKFVYGERGTLGDESPEVHSRVEEMLNTSFAAELLAKIDPSKTHDLQFYIPKYKAAPSGGTSQISVISPDEQLVSITSSMNWWFGSHVITDSGILLNNQMNDFNIPGRPTANESLFNPANDIAPGKSPLSTMIPTVLHSKKPCGLRIAIGGEGSTAILGAVVDVLLGFTKFGMTISDAIEAPRLFNTLSPNKVQYEDGISSSIIEYLKGLGHQVGLLESDHKNIVNAVLKVDRDIQGHADSRKGGAASIF
ncbi:unnamed protein product [Owenia fusiformis]|uniref:Uncharacterized protein n=1 Tax=Owenia fusiformis TaxID=6347 RepID=A0A8J1UBQ2_OWEFU|nr:unnamed protein product [Owenia fusiformis]